MKGNVFDETNPPKNSQEAIVAANADWLVHLVPNHRDIASLVPEGYEGDTLIENEGEFSVVRSTDFKHLATVKSKYNPLQNHEAFGFFDRFIEDGTATFEAGGVLQGGKRIWAVARLNEGAAGEVIDGDRVATYFTLFNSHDGSSNVGLMFNGIRSVCANTLNLAISEAGSNIVKVPHTKNMHNSLSLIQNTIDMARKTFVVTLEQYRLMQEKKLDIHGLAQFASKALLPKNPTLDMDKLPTIVKRVIECAENGRGANIPGVKGTVWSAYNAVTEFVDHHQGRSYDSRTASSLFGAGAKSRERAHNLAVEMISGKI